LLFKRYAGCALILLTLVGCATPPPPPPLSDCQRVALYAQAVAGFRDMGLPAEQLGKPVRADVTFPVDGVQREVYARPELSPPEIHDMFFAVCTERGYWRLHVTMRELKLERTMEQF
jgi:hypothetical protein